jgi:hypothetical protein
MTRDTCSQRAGKWQVIHRQLKAKILQEQLKRKAVDEHGDQLEHDQDMLG